MALSAGCSPQNKVATPQGAAGQTVPRVLDPLAKSAVVQGNTGFGIALLKDLVPRLKANENLFISPFSVSQAVLLAANGTQNATQAAFLKSLQLGDTGIDTVNSDTKALIVLLDPPQESSQGKSLPAYEWTVANAIWSRDKPKPGYIALCAQNYSARAARLTTASAVNDWASEKTRGRITDIVDDNLVRQADLLLTNAVYFKGYWKAPFAHFYTTDAPFYPQDPSQKRDQPFMHREDHEMFWYAGDNYEAVSLPYRGGMSMVVLLPQSGLSANVLAGSLAASDWEKLTAGFRPTWVALALPKFEIEYQAALLPPLKSLGMPVSGDFSTISDTLQKTTIVAVVHKTFLRVDEAGSEAAAVTMIAAAGGPPPPVPKDKPRPFVVDRPFLCAIVHDATGAVLFLGVINDPKAPKESPTQ